jgi:4-phytase / acid phosphatase
MSANRLFATFLLVAAVLIAPLLVTPALSQTSQLRMVVVLTRHGVRSPLSHATTSPDQKQPWHSLDQWHVTCPGDLTPRGTELVQQMGSFYHEYYADKGLLPADGQCPASKAYIWADNEERTLGTAHALAAGMSKGIAGCVIPVNSLAYTPAPQSGRDKCAVNKKDPTDYFFHPLSYPPFLRTPNGPIDTDKVKDVAKQINQEVPHMLITYHPPLLMLQNTLCGGPSAVACSSVLGLPTEAKADGTSLKWTGMFSVSSTATENFLLEYGNGMPCNLDGWGLVTYNSPDCDGGQSFRQMQELHTLYFDWTHHDGYMGQIQGSNLANQILLKLEQGASGAKGRPFVIYSGHDTDVASVAGLLQLDWTLTDLPRNDTPPAGALIFELWGGTTADTQAVRMYYVHQTLTQMRKLEDLTLENPPSMVELQLPRCAKPCPFGQFQKIANAAILPGLTTTGPSGESVKNRMPKKK